MGEIEQQRREFRRDYERQVAEAKEAHESRGKLYRVVRESPSPMQEQNGLLEMVRLLTSPKIEAARAELRAASMAADARWAEVLRVARDSSAPKPPPCCQCGRPSTKAQTELPPYLCAACETREEALREALDFNPEPTPTHDV